jgi:hypothetical protein
MGVKNLAFLFLEMIQISFQWFYDDVPAIVCAHQCSMNFIISQGAVSGQSRDFGSY